MTQIPGMAYYIKAKVDQNTGYYLYKPTASWWTKKMQNSSQKKVEENAIDFTRISTARSSGSADPPSQPSNTTTRQLPSGGTITQGNISQEEFGAMWDRIGQQQQQFMQGLERQQQQQMQGLGMTSGPSSPSSPPAPAIEYRGSGSGRPDIEEID